MFTLSAMRRPAFVGAALLLVSFSLHAALIPVDLDGDVTNEHEGVYDDVLDITWLADAKLAASNDFNIAGIGAGGVMGWASANAYIEAMNGFNGGAGWLGVNSWRLPRVNPVNGVSLDLAVTYDGSSDTGFQLSAPIDSNYNQNGQSPGATSSELAYHYYNNFSAIGDCSGVSTANTFGCVGSGISGLPVALDPANNKSLFSNIGEYEVYWTGTEESAGAPNVFKFNNYFGRQFTWLKTDADLVWPVAPGMVGAFITWEYVVQIVENQIRAEASQFTNFDQFDPDLEDFPGQLLAELVKSRIIEYRESDGANEILRDGEYAVRNFIGGQIYKLILEGKTSFPNTDIVDIWTQNPGTTGAYNAAKTVGNFLGLGSLFRADENNTNSEPGGFDAAVEGFRRGYNGERLEGLHPEANETEQSNTAPPENPKEPLDFDNILGVVPEFEVPEEAIFIAAIDPNTEADRHTYIDPQFNQKYNFLAGYGPKIKSIKIPVGQGYDNENFIVWVEGEAFELTPGVSFDLYDLGYSQGIYEFELEGASGLLAQQSYVVGLEFMSAGFIALAYSESIDEFDTPMLDLKYIALTMLILIVIAKRQKALIE